MENKNRIDLLLFQVAEIIQVIQNHKGPIAENISPSLLEDIEKLEKTFAQFNELSEKSFKESHIDIEQLRTETVRSTNTSAKDKQLLQRAKNIERDARKLQLSLSKAMERGKRQGATTHQDPLKRKIKERRKLFKPLGGDRNWIPL